MGSPNKPQLKKVVRGKGHQHLTSEPPPLPRRALWFGDYLVTYVRCATITWYADESQREHLTLPERIQEAIATRPWCLITALKPERDGKHVSFPGIPLNTEHMKADEFGYKWCTAFSQKRLKELFDRYHIPGYDLFCLAMTPENYENYPLYKFLLPSHILKNSTETLEGEDLNTAFEAYFSKLHETLRSTYRNDCMPPLDFLSWLKRLREIAEKLTIVQQLESDILNNLNHLETSLPKKPDIACDFICETFQSMLDDLQQRSLAGRCLHCRALFSYRRDKKYCSPVHEGKNCGKRARDRRYYSTRGVKRSPHRHLA